MHFLKMKLEDVEYGKRSVEFFSFESMLFIDLLLAKLKCDFGNS